MLRWASLTVRRLSSTNAWKKSEIMRLVMSLCTFVTMESEENERSTILPFGADWKSKKDDAYREKSFVVLPVTKSGFCLFFGNWVVILEISEVSLKLKLTDLEVVRIREINNLVHLVFCEKADYQSVDCSVFANNLTVNKLFERLPNCKTVSEVGGH